MSNVFIGTATDDIGPMVIQYRRGHSYKTTKMGQINSDVGLVCLFVLFTFIQTYYVFFVAVNIVVVFGDDYNDDFSQMIS